MYKIKPKIKQKKRRYEGLKSKIIHLEPKVFEILDTVAKMKNSNLKEYIETLCLEQAKYEAKEFLKQYEENKKVKK